MTCLRLLVPLVVALADTTALAQPAPASSTFDGAWNVTMTCPPHNEEDDDAKGYTHRYTGQVTAGELRAVHGTDGEPGWHLLRGRIGDDGNAALRLEGVVSNARYAINGAERGKRYSYRVKAHFDGSSGTGERLTGRTCTFVFKR